MAQDNNRKLKGGTPGGGAGTGGLKRLLKFLGTGGARAAGEGIQKKKKKRRKILDILRSEGQ